MKKMWVVEPPGFYLEDVTRRTIMPTYMFGPRVSTQWIRTLRVTLLLAAVAGCGQPRFKAPQVQGLPGGFLKNPGAARDRDLFPNRTAIHYDVWVHARFDTFTGIYITGYPGTTSRAEVEVAQWNLNLERRRAKERAKAKADR